MPDGRPDFDFDLDLGRPHTHVHDLFSMEEINVLVVVESFQIRIAEGGNGFGVGRFVRLLRETTLGCTRFNVDVADRSSGAFADNGAVAPGAARYVGFRFDSQVAGQLVLDRYDEAFLFGFRPGNDAGPDSNITLPGSLPASDDELLRLMQWMNAGGGLFATGDHDYLGASMCSRIPRIGTMRRWTNAQGVPPINGLTRLDTNQPATVQQAMGFDEIPNEAEEDATPQPLDWVPYRVFDNGVFRRRYPHEVLCHPKLGPINVMPDHPHEGYCIERSLIDATATVNFGGGAVDEYPAVDGHRELPQVIAYGSVVPHPPFDHEKGGVNPTTIPMISVYDGRVAGVGRVVTDSTWHHWFDMNINGLEAAADKTNWKKVSRYFVNVAKWIAPPGTYVARCWWMEILGSHFDYPGIEEYGTRHDLGNGRALHSYLSRIHGPCTVLELVVQDICDRFPILCKLVEHTIPKFPKPDPCLTCPPWDIIERVVLTGYVEGTRPIAERLRASLEAGEKRFTIEVEEIARAARQGADEALAALAERVVHSAEEVATAFGELTRSSPAQSS
ncbi:MAG TPA: hypothetical protein VF230_18980 [Acidimicrobiales bacterium]